MIEFIALSLLILIIVYVIILLIKKKETFNVNETPTTPPPTTPPPTTPPPIIIPGVEKKLYLNPPSDANELGIFEVPIKLSCDSKDDCTILEGFKSKTDEQIINTHIININDIVSKIDSSVNQINRELDNYINTYNTNKNALSKSLEDRNKKLLKFTELFNIKNTEKFENISPELINRTYKKTDFKTDKTNLILLK